MKLYSVIVLTNGQYVFAKISNDVNEGCKVLLLEDPLVEEEIFMDDGSTITVMKNFCRATEDKKIPIIKDNIVSIMAMSPVFKEYYKAAIKVNELSQKAYNDSLVALTEKLYFKLHAVEQAENQIMYSILDTDSDTIH